MNQISQEALVNYIRKEGSKFTQEDTNVIGSEITRLANRFGELTKEGLVESARSPKSPLHRYFEWNDTIAAEKYRYTQAQYMFRMIQIEVITHDDERVEMNIVSSISGSEGRKYIPTQNAVRDPINREFVVKEAWRGLLGWVKRYEGFMEHEPIFRNIRLSLRKAGYLD